MDHFLDWLAMGGYSVYVWPAYGLVTAVLLLNLLAVKRQKMRTRQKLQLWFKRSP